MMATAGTPTNLKYKFCETSQSCQMTDRYAIIGNPVEHSKSPEIHAEFARQMGQDIVYERLFAPLDGFVQTVDAFLNAYKLNAAGVNVTVPFKVEAFRYANRLTPRALRGGAVNTLKFEGATVLGDNTDGVGLCADIERNLGFQIAGARVLVMGAGGAARGVVGNLLDARPGLLAITNRSIDKAEAISAQFGGTEHNQGNNKIRVMSLGELPRQQFDLIINATSASLSERLPLVPTASFAPDALAYDMMYGKGQTPFLALAASTGARTADGLGMLIEQAAEAFYVWRGLRPSTSSVLAMLRKQLGRTA